MGGVDTKGQDTTGQVAGGRHRCISGKFVSSVHILAAASVLVSYSEYIHGAAKYLAQRLHVYV